MSKKNLYFNILYKIFFVKKAKQKTHENTAKRTNKDQLESQNKSSVTNYTFLNSKW